MSTGYSFEYGQANDNNKVLKAPYEQTNFTTKFSIFENILFHFDMCPGTPWKLAKWCMKIAHITIFVTFFVEILEHTKEMDWRG